MEPAASMSAIPCLVIPLRKSTRADPANIFSDAPGLLPLADQGCATPAGGPGTAACVMTHALNAGSAAIDAGANPLGLSTDERGTGFPRTFGVQTDSALLNLPAI